MATATAPSTEPTVTLRSPRDVSLTVIALEHRADTLEKLAKKNQEEDYPREAKTQLSDAAAIKSVILPAFRAQQELPLVDPDDSRQRIADALAPIVRSRLTLHITDKQATTPGEQEDLLRGREEFLCESLARRVHAYAVAVAETAYRAGYAAREHEPEVLAHQELAVLGAAE